MRALIYSFIQPLARSRDNSRFHSFTNVLTESSRTYQAPVPPQKVRRTCGIPFGSRTRHKPKDFGGGEKMKLVVILVRTKGEVRMSSEIRLKRPANADNSFTTRTYTDRIPSFLLFTVTTLP